MKPHAAWSMIIDQLPGVMFKQSCLISHSISWKPWKQGKNKFCFHTDLLVTVTTYNQRISCSKKTDCWLIYYQNEVIHAKPRTHKLNYLYQTLSMNHRYPNWHRKYPLNLYGSIEAFSRPFGVAKYLSEERLQSCPSNRKT